MFLDPENPIERSLRNLPHWQQTDAITFVTFRLADAIPARSMRMWAEDRRRWLLARGVSGEGGLSETLLGLVEEERRRYFREFGRRFHELLDAGSGACVLRDPDCSSIVANALEHFDGERYDLTDYVVMPNHVHVLVAPREGHSLTEVLHSWKRFTAREINRLIGRDGQLWQHESFDHLVRDAGSLEGFVRYVRDNPAKAKLREGEYRLR
ncbi:transposase [Luteolibacter sp. LG18]|uniref:transposase n=1 Tax=Luteolibacter sp. LG18 TaxID=2819286 RepID=UPI0030C73F43